MPSNALSVGMDVDGAAQTLAAFKALPKEASDELRKGSLELAELLARRVAAAGRSEGRQAALLAGTVKARRDRIPSLAIGGTRKMFHGEKDGSEREAFQALFGSEFGGDAHGFKPPRREGYWIFPTVKASQDEIADAWTEVADRIIRQFSEGGPRG